MNKEKKTSKTKFQIIVSFIALCIVVFAVYMYFFYGKDNSISQNEQISPQKENISPDGTREYRNITQGFYFRYPSDLTIKEYDESDGTYTIVFADKTGEKSFQIFFTPYYDDAITQSRILKDVPSGKFTKPIEIVLGDGIHALTFVSDGTFGKLREVWFIHDGFLFQATTYDNLDNWLSEITKTWRFFEPGSGGGR